MSPERAAPDFGDIEVALGAFARERGIAPPQDCSTMRQSYRRTYRLGEAVIAKAFAPGATAPYRRELAFLSGGVVTDRIPELVEARFEADIGGFIAMRVIEGRLLSEAMPGLAPDELVRIVGDLGQCLASIHAGRTIDGADTEPSGLEAERRKHFDAFEENVAYLARARILPGAALAAAVEVVARARSALFCSERRLLHGDVHSGNVLLRGTTGRAPCALIDFEESGPSARELDFVYPLLDILGEALPGRRLEGHWDETWDAFADGYAHGGSRLPDPGLLASHALAWFFWVSTRCHRRGDSRYRKYARQALGVLWPADRSRWNPDWPAEIG